MATLPTTTACREARPAAPRSMALLPRAQHRRHPWNTQLCDPHNAEHSLLTAISAASSMAATCVGIQNELDYIQGLGFDTLYLNPIFYASSNHRYDTDDFLNIDPALGGNAALDLAADGHEPAGHARDPRRNLRRRLFGQHVFQRVRTVFHDRRVPVAELAIAALVSIPGQQCAVHYQRL